MVGAVSKPKMVLMIGGPADGRWMVTDGNDIIVAEPPSLEWTALSADPLRAIDFRRVQYRVQSCSMFGHALDVAIAEMEFRSSQDRDQAIVRALFQRDVAEAMGAYR